MKDLLLFLLGIIVAIIILGLIAQTFWLSRILSIIFSIVTIVCTYKGLVELEWIGYCTLAIIFAQSRYGMNPYKTGWVEVYRDGTAAEEWAGGFLSTILVLPILMALAHTFIISKFTFLLYAIPILILVLNIVNMIYKVVTGEELLEPDTWFKPSK